MASAHALRWFPRRGRPGGGPVIEPEHDFVPADFAPALKTRLLVLQPTPFCNIDCDYCYLPDRDSKARMSLATVRHAARRLLDDGLVGDELTVVWHAGEPLTMPPAFYDEAIAVVAEVLGTVSAVSHSMQTNATLINDAWCDLFLRHHVRVGVSVDGPALVHDRHRRTRTGGGTHERVLRGMQCLRAHGIGFHAIAVVTDATFADPDGFLDFFVQQGVQELGCNFDEAEGIHRRSSLDGAEAAHAVFLGRLLDRCRDGGLRLRVRELANAYQLIARGLPTYRWQGRAWPDNAQVVPFALINVAWNGDFGTFSPELLGQPSQEFENFTLGNVADTGFFDSARTPRFARLWNAVVRGTEACRHSCTHFHYCGGGAPANKLYENGDLASAETLYCRTMIKRPFDAVLHRLEQEQQPAPLLQEA